MHGYLQTFYLWLVLFSVCNVVTLISALLKPSGETKTLLLFSIAWIFQFPLVLMVSLIHQGINNVSRILPAAWKKPVRFSLCAFCAFVVMGMYLASQVMYQQIDTFISWDAFRAALSNAHQIIPDIMVGIGGQLLLGGGLAIVFSLIYTRRSFNQASSHCPKIFSLLCLIFLTSGAGGVAFVYMSKSDATHRVRKDMLPTTYLTFSLIDTLLPTSAPSVDFLKDMVLTPQISMDEFIPADSMTNQPNVFFIFLESISSDHFGFTGYGREAVSPNLDELAKDSLVFPRAYAAANHSNYSQTSTHASQYPLRRKKLDQFEVINYPKTLLMDVLGHGGYQTAFFSAQNEDWQGMKTFINADTQLQHFFHSKDELGHNIGAEAKIDDALVLKRAVEYLEASRRDRPVFMYLNFQATHFPYAIPETASKLFEPCSTDEIDFNYTHYDTDHMDRVVNKYDNALHYVDDQVGELIEWLKQNDLYENSLIVVASDHGEAFYKHGLPTHGTTLFEDQICTAALFKLPKAEITGVRSDSISLIDINPTILEILGLENHPNFQGRPVLRRPRNEPVYLVSHSLVKSHGIVDYPWKYFTSERDGERLSNLETDPDELQNFSADQPERMNELKQKLQLFQQRQLYYYTVLPQRERDESYPPQH